jgi:DNA-binding NtrC family response regulator
MLGKKAPFPVKSSEKITVLLVSQEPEDAAVLESAVPGQRLRIHRCPSVSEVAAAIDSCQPSVVVSEGELPDGTWRSVLTETDSRGKAVPVLVVSRQADEHFWAEVLNLGGFDVLVKPFDASEVSRVLQMALRYWENLPGNLTPNPA